MFPQTESNPVGLSATATIAKLLQSKRPYRIHPPKRRC